MPPAAIASSEPIAAASAVAEPVRAWWRSRWSRLIAWGNFGARPNPPRLPSCAASMPIVASSSTSTPGRSPPAVAAAGRRSAPTRRPACSITWSRSDVHASWMAPSSWVNVGPAPRASAGK